jgi:hypothetical protein
MKIYRIYDVSNRIEYQYECVTTTAHGEPCLKTQYEYDGASTRVLKLKETLDVWDSSYEI